MLRLANSYAKKKPEKKRVGEDLATLESVCNREDRSPPLLFYSDPSDLIPAPSMGSLLFDDVVGWPLLYCLFPYCLLWMFSLTFTEVFFRLWLSEWNCLDDLSSSNQSWLGFKQSTHN